MVTTPTDQLVKQSIVALAAEHWSEERVLLLAQIGQYLTRQGINLRDALGNRKLAAYLADELEGVLRVVPSPTDPLVQAVVPAVVEQENITADHFKRAGRRATDVSHGKRFDRSLWLAFSRLIAPGQKRIVTLGDKVVFVDLPESAEVATGVPVGADDIVPVIDGQTKHDRDLQIAQKITQWIERNGVQSEAVLERQQQPRVQTQRSESALGLLLATLDADEMRRISMPLDIVNKLYKKSWQ